MLLMPNLLIKHIKVNRKAFVLFVFIKKAAMFVICSLAKKEANIIHHLYIMQYVYVQI